MNQLWSEKTFPMLYNGHGQVIWTDREEQRLMNSYRKIPTERILTLFPGRTWSALQTRASRLKIPRKGRHYTNYEDSLLMKLYNDKNLTYDQMTQFFIERGSASLRMRIYHLRKRGVL